MATVNGVVKNFSQKSWKGKSLYSICVADADGNEKWYGAGENNVTSIPKGSVVTFNAEQKGNFFNIQGEVVVDKSAPPPAASGGNSYAARENYWQEKADRDVESDKRYNLRAAYMFAKDIAVAVYTHGDLKATKGKELEALLGLIDTIAEDYYDKWMSTSEQEGPQDTDDDMPAPGPEFD